MNILHLEDNSADAELTEARLHTRWPDCSVTTVASREAFEQAVQRGGFDLILSDFSLPNYSGLNALAYARAHHPKTPFIYLSGTIGEERAIEALKSGANDYVLKDRSARLIPAIDAALTQFEQAEAHREAEEKVKEQASLLDKSREAICVADANGSVTYWNASAERLYGWSAAEAIGRNLREMLHGQDHADFDAAYARVLAEGEWRGELRSQPRSGEPILVESFWSLVTDDQGLPKSILLIDTDMTARRKLENQLMQSQRLETLGLLVGGIAHDLNNVLAPIVTTVDLLRQSRLSASDSELLGIMDVSAHHGTDLVRQLLAFARGRGEQRGELAVDALIGSIGKLLRHAMPPGIEIRSSLDKELWSVNADATQLRQVILNLCLNARDALPQGGTIEIRAHDVEVAADTPSMQGEVKAGPHVCISVRDTGTGMPPEVVGKIFEPFFTTKSATKGTGLGLANVAMIVKSHGGFLNLESQPGVGTTFHIYLPALRSKTAGETGVAAKHSAMQGREEHILVIEDDDDIRTILEVFLSTRGYRVTVAASGEEGLEQFHAQPGAFAVVMTDMNMLGVSGTDVIREIRTLPNPPKFIVLSGLAPEPHEEAEALIGVEFLRKPMTMESLLGTLQRVLEAPAPEVSGSAGANLPGSCSIAAMASLALSRVA